MQDKVGVFEGASYEAKGLYRPAIDCIMFSRNKVGFCPVCRRAINQAIDQAIDQARTRLNEILSTLSKGCWLSMRRQYRCAVLAVPACRAALLLAAQESPAPSRLDGRPIRRRRLQLVWADEFEQDGNPDPANWTYERGFVRNEEAAMVSGRERHLLRRHAGDRSASRKSARIPRFRAGSRNWQTSREFAEYTSSCLITKGLHSWKHGRFEMRGRIDTRAGIWPAWWTLGVEGRWPAGGEIDIMEYYRNMLLANVAWAGRQPDGRRFVHWDDLKLPLAELGDDWSNQFHVWRMDWDETRIELSVDGRVLNTTDLKEAVNPEGTQPAQPFQQPHYMLLNLAMGGTNGGDPSATEFPARFEVDYVRVYQKQRRNQPQYIPRPQPVKTDLLIGTHPVPADTTLGNEYTIRSTPVASPENSRRLTGLRKGHPHERTERISRSDAASGWPWPRRCWAGCSMARRWACSAWSAARRSRTCCRTPRKRNSISGSASSWPGSWSARPPAASCSAGWEIASDAFAR